jgi:hypothetical protein
LRAENARLREGSAMSDEFYPVPPHSTRRLECLPAGEIGALRAEIKRLRADNERLRAALKKIASRDWQDPFDYIDLARTALRET